MNTLVKCTSEWLICNAPLTGKRKRFCKNCRF